MVYSDLSPEVSIQNARYSPELDKLFLATESDGFLILSKKNFSTITNKNKLFKSNYYLQIPLIDGNIITNGGTLNNSKDHNELFENHILNNNYLYLNKSEFIESTPKISLFIILKPKRFKY